MSAKGVERLMERQLVRRGLHVVMETVWRQTFWYMLSVADIPSQTMCFVGLQRRNFQAHIWCTFAVFLNAVKGLSHAAVNMCATLPSSASISFRT